MVQQIGDRFYKAGQRFSQRLSKVPWEKKSHKYRSLVYPQKGEIPRVKEIRTRSKKNRKKLMPLRLSKLGVFKVIVHRGFPPNKVKRVVVKLMPSEEIYISFVVEGYDFNKFSNTIGLLLSMLRLRGS
jgi:putative transposase